MSFIIVSILTTYVCVSPQVKRKTNQVAFFLLILKYPESCIYHKPDLWHLVRKVQSLLGYPAPQVWFVIRLIDGTSGSFVRLPFPRWIFISDSVSSLFFWLSGNWKVSAAAWRILLGFQGGILLVAFHCRSAIAAADHAPTRRQMLTRSMSSPNSCTVQRSPHDLRSPALTRFWPRSQTVLCLPPPPDSYSSSG